LQDEAAGRRRHPRSLHQGFEASAAVEYPQHPSTAEN
jgi:hypothetical protein